MAMGEVRMAATKEVADLFRERWDEFTRTDRKVARIILANYPAAGLETLAQLSDRASVSAPSILRCVKKLGFDGYPEFQKALHAELHYKIRNTIDIESFDNSAAHLPPRLQEGSQRYFNNISETFGLLNTAELANVVTLLSDKSRSLTLLGGVSSGALAQFFYRRLIMIRPNCSLLSRDPLERSEKLIEIGKRDVIVAFDHPPYDTNTASFAALAHERNAKVVLFTDTAMSPISNFAEAVLCAAGGPTEHFSIASTVCLAEIVFSEVQLEGGQHADDRRRELSEIDSG
jgi:DNA-binding MurR/RpiR family transcriptional regulator